MRLRPYDIVRPSDKAIQEIIEQERRLTPMFIGFYPGMTKDGDIRGVKKEKNLKELELRLTTVVGMITETNGDDASVSWFNDVDRLKNAWWENDELVVIGNSMMTACNAMAHPFGGNKEQAQAAFFNAYHIHEDDFGTIKVKADPEEDI